MPIGEIYPRLLRYTWRHKKWLGIAAIGMAGYAGADTALIYILKPLLDGSIVDRDPWMIRWISRLASLRISELLCTSWTCPVR